MLFKLNRKEKYRFLKGVGFIREILFCIAAIILYPLFATSLFASGLGFSPFSFYICAFCGTFLFFGSLLFIKYWVHFRPIFQLIERQINFQLAYAFFHQRFTETEANPPIPVEKEQS